MAYLSFTNAKAAERGATIIAGSFAPETDSGGGHPASTDGYDAYGIGYTCSRVHTGVVEVALSRAPKRIISAVGCVESTANKDMNVTSFHPCPYNGSSTVRFRMLTAATPTDLAHNDRFHFIIIADYSSA